MTPRLFIALLVLSIAALASWYVARDDGESAADRSVNGPVHRGYYLEDARILGTDVDGRLLYEIRAKRAEQQPDQRIRFSSVEIEYSPGSDVPWSIRADAATLSPIENKVYLEGNVRAQSDEGFSGDATELRTTFLTLDPENYLAQTDERIHILIGDRSLTGIGMLASLKENRMEIRSNVSGRFIP